VPVGEDFNVDAVYCKLSILDQICWALFENVSKVKYVDLYSALSQTASNALSFPVSRRWFPQANPTARYQRTLRDHVIRVGVSRDMPVYSPDYAEYSFSLGRLRLSRPGCLVPRRGGVPVQRRSPTWALTGPSVELLHWSSGTCYRYAKPANNVTGFCCFRHTVQTFLRHTSTVSAIRLNRRYRQSLVRQRWSSIDGPCFQTTFENTFVIQTSVFITR